MKNFENKNFFYLNRFWDAVQELKCVHSRDVAQKVQEIWNEYLGPGIKLKFEMTKKSTNNLN